MKHYIYYHIDPIYNQIRYIGKGSGRRAYELHHKRNKEHLEWVKTLEENGYTVKIEILFWFESESEAYAKEAELIELHKKEGLLFNKVPGGRLFGYQSFSGSAHPSFGKKMPQLSGKNNGMFGKKRTDLVKRNQEAKGKTIDEMYGNKKAKSLRNKLSIATKGENNPMFGKTGELAPAYGRTGEKHPMFGKTQTDEAKRKISQSLKKSRGKAVIRSDGKKYICLIDAAKDLGIKDQKIITKVLTGKRKDINGFTFQYLKLNS